MKKILISLFLCTALSMSGCTLIKQSSRTHKAIEAQNYDVDKVAVQVKNGHKSVVVHTLQVYDAAGIETIKTITKKEIPDAENISVVQP